MLRHMVLFKFKADYTEDQLQAAIDAIDSLPGKVPQIKALAHGKDAGLAPAKYDYAMVVDFASSEDFLVYADHPDHKAAGAQIMAIVEEPLQMQFFYD